LNVFKIFTRITVHCETQTGKSIASAATVIAHQASPANNLATADT